MSRDDSPPFERGQTFYGGSVIDPTNLGGDSLLGQEFRFEDEDFHPTTTGARSIRSPRAVICRVVRNTSPINLLPKRLAQFDAASTADNYDRCVVGYVNTTAGRGYPVDEFLPAAGVPPNDLFYIVVKGPSKIQTDNAAIGANINVGDQVVAGTFASSTNTTQGGRLQSQDLTGATAPLANQIRYAVGHALSAVTTAQTATDLMVDVGRW